MLSGFLLGECVYAQVGNIQDSIKTYQQKLDSIRIKLEKYKAIITELAQKEEISLNRLDAIQRKIALTKKTIDELKNQIYRRNKEIEELQAQIVTIDSQIKQRQEIFKKRLIAIYKYSRISGIQMVVTSKNIPEFYKRAQMLRFITRQDRELINELSNLKHQLQTKHQTLVNALTNLNQLENEAQVRQHELEENLKEESQLLARIRKEKETNLRIQQELQERSVKLHKLVDSLIASIPVSDTSLHLFENQKGKLPWPIKGMVIAKFGLHTHPQYRTKTNNLGIDIKPSGSGEVFSIAPGKVVYADRFIGYGNLVIIDHGGGYYTLYANLSDINTVVGAEVYANKLIGTVDDYLHFEIRKEGKPLNPLDYLASGP